MSRTELKSKFKENAVAWTIIALLSSGGGSAVTALRGPDSDETKERMQAVHSDIQDVKVQIARISQKLDDFIDHSRSVRVSAVRP